MTVRYTVVDGEVLSELRDGVKRDYVPDPSGSIVALLDSSQNITDTFSYWPYGESAGRTGTTATPFQYVGTFGYYQDGTARSYVRARYLDKSKGRWITEDPLGQIDGPNSYKYCMNNPINRIDRQGLSCWMEIPENWWWEIFFGIPYSHAYISFSKPCKITNPAHSLFPNTLYNVGYYPWERLHGNSKTQKGGFKVHCGSTPQFEKALCDCVNNWVISGSPIVCGTYASKIWDCAREKAKDDPDYPWLNPAFEYPGGFQVF